MADWLVALARPALSACGTLIGYFNKRSAQWPNFRSEFRQDGDHYDVELEIENHTPLDMEIVRVEAKGPIYLGRSTDHPIYGPGGDVTGYDIPYSEGTSISSSVVLKGQRTQRLFLTIRTSYPCIWPTVRLRSSFMAQKRMEVRNRNAD